ncbi:GTPase [Ruminococcus sp.]|uniref:GTPase n=1 Tax=Ruminococcus sp. TaxID=41978 RepID=UPI003AB476C5
MEGDKIKTNILIAGKSGVGKSSLLNYIFGEEVAETGAGKPVTAEGLHEYSFELKDNDRISFSICDSWGLEPDKADEWHKQIIDKVAEYDKHSINEWFSTIIYCLSADSDRVEDFEISIINDLIAEKNNVNVVITHCKSENDDRAERMKKRIVEDGSVSADSVIFVNNYEKKLISGEVKKFGREEVVNCIIRNLWNNYKVKVPYKIKEHANEMFRSEQDKLHDMVASTRFVLRKHHKLDKFEEEINNEFGMFVFKSVMKLNNEFNDAYNYYQQLSQEYYAIVFGMDALKLLNDPIMFFDATKAFKEEVSQQVEKDRRINGKNTEIHEPGCYQRAYEKAFCRDKDKRKDGKSYQK